MRQIVYEYRLGTEENTRVSGFGLDIFLQLKEQAHEIMFKEIESRDDYFFEELSIQNSNLFMSTDVFTIFYCLFVENIQNEFSVCFHEIQWWAHRVDR